MALPEPAPPPRSTRPLSGNEPPRPSVAAAIMAGSVATLVMTPLALVPVLAGGGMDFAGLLGSLVTGGETPRLSTTWLIGMALHILNGAVIFPLVYALILYRRLPGAPVTRALSWAGALWLASMVVMLAAEATRLTLAVAAISLAAHLVYGALLGWLSSPRVVRSLEG